jgi:hypothetical protein
VFLRTCLTMDGKIEVKTQMLVVLSALIWELSVSKTHRSFRLCCRSWKRWKGHLCCVSTPKRSCKSVGGGGRQAALAAVEASPIGANAIVDGFPFSCVANCSSQSHGTGGDALSFSHFSISRSIELFCVVSFVFSCDSRLLTCFLSFSFIFFYISIGRPPSDVMVMVMWWWTDETPPLSVHPRLSFTFLLPPSRTRIEMLLMIVACSPRY